MTTEEKQKACSKEIQEVLKKYGFALAVQENPIIVMTEIQKEKSEVVTAK